MECESQEKKMVATLQSRREALEAKLKEKTVELKKLCIQEAELTGTLPPDTPLAAGERPPVFRRRIGTAFAYPENLINKLRCKEDESLASLELECRIQMSIAEAALGLANDDNANKSIRRKHRLMYQQSQRRLVELESRLNLLRQSVRGSNHLKPRKKPRPPLNSDTTDSVDELHADQDSRNLNPSYNYTRSQEPMSLSVTNRDVIRNSTLYNNYGKSYNSQSPLLAYMRQNNHNIQGKLDCGYPNTFIPYHHHHDQPQPHSAITICGRENRNWVDDSYVETIAPVGYYSNQFYGVTTSNDKMSRLKSRYGSLDRRYSSSRSNSSSDHQYYPDSHHASPIPNPVTSQMNSLPSESFNNDALHSGSEKSLQNVILLPNQTYPENSLTRTQSLGNVDHPKKAPDTFSLGKMQDNFQSNTLGRKKEKEWHETSIDFSPLQTSCTPPLHPRATKQVGSPLKNSASSLHYGLNTPPPLPPPPTVLTEKPSSPVRNVSPIKSPTLIDASVPFESPKNHTVVEVGKWQPYREVTKPFEMSDFYKYSTKFRKNTANNADQNPNNFPGKNVPVTNTEKHIPSQNNNFYSSQMQPRLLVSHNGSLPRNHVNDGKSKDGVNTFHSSYISDTPSSNFDETNNQNNFNKFGRVEAVNFLC